MVVKMVQILLDYYVAMLAQKFMSCNLNFEIQKCLCAHIIYKTHFLILGHIILYIATIF